MSLQRSIIIIGALALGAGLALACSSNNNKNTKNAPSLPTKGATIAPLTTSAAAAASPTRAASPAIASAAATTAAGTPAGAPGPAASALPVCPPSGSGTNLTGAGSTFDNPLFSKLFDVYNQQCKIQVNYQSIGSGGGIEQLTKKTVNFGATDAPLTDEQIATAGGDVIHIPVTIAAVAIAYNVPGLKSGVQFSGDVLAKIFLGTIKKWNDPAIKALNPNMSLPDLDISVTHRSDGSGTSAIFTNYLSAVSLDWKTKVGAGTSLDWPTGAGGKGSEGVAGLVKQTPGSIGYFELAYATQNSLATVTMQNKAGKFVAPSVDGASVAAASAVNSLPPDLRAIFVDAPGDATYPITGFSWIAISKAQSDAKVGTSLAYLLWWMVHDGQKYSKDLTYAPLPDPVVKLDEGQLKKITVAGKPVITQ